MRTSALLIVSLFVLPPALADGPPVPLWVWSGGGEPRPPRADLTREFEAGDGLLSAGLTGVGDFCDISVSLNGREVAAVEDFSPRFRFDVTDGVRPGRNVIRVSGRGHDGPSAVALRLELRYRDGTGRFVVTDRRWRTAEGGAAEFGPLDAEPWGDHPDTLSVSPAEDYTQWKRALGADADAEPSNFSLPPGYRIELLRAAGPDEGSWIALAFDPRGRLTVAREDRGLLRVSFGDDGRVSSVEAIDKTLKECRGLLYAHGALYANANESRGLYRLRDTAGDDRFDEVKLLLATEGPPGHGRNGLALGPDGLIYAIHGDSVGYPEVARDFTSPFREQGPRARSGFVLRTDPDGRRWEMLLAGTRNPYGIDFNPEGEMFTYDADAEYDTGSSWYRPTRILHLLPGADYGWREVTRSWPSYFPDAADAPPPLLDVGRGSPTAVKFGTAGRFPGRDRRALFALDWTYGRVLAVHMTPRGAGYAARAETFLQGRPFNVTDLAFGPDGAMYLATGGRKTRSGLYRVSHVGGDAAEPEPFPQRLAREAFSAAARKSRARLESFHGRDDPAALDAAWPHLDSPDPVLRHAARIAVEHRPVASWRALALAEERPRAAPEALMALARCSEADHPAVVDRLARLPSEGASVTGRLTVLRAAEIVLSRRDGPDEVTAACHEILDAMYPAGLFELDAPLARLLAEGDRPGFVARTLGLLDRAATQREQFHYVYVLRQVDEGWTPGERERYFRWLARMRTFEGGEGMPAFIARIEADATGRLGEAERRAVEPLLARPAAVVELPPEAADRPFVREWTVADLEGTLADAGRGRDFDRGERMFRAASCVACHRVGTAGAAVGPDLTSVARRFGRRDLLASIVEPDAVVAEQYRRDVVTTFDGRVIVGTILQDGDYRSPDLRLLTNPLNPAGVVTIPKREVESHEKSNTSVMPGGLLNTLSREEILDLLAYLESGGDRKHPAFRE